MLSGLAKRIAKDAATANVGTPDDAAALAARLGR